MATLPEEQYDRESWMQRDYAGTMLGHRENTLKEHINSLYNGGASVAAKDIPPVKGITVGSMYWDITDKKPYWFDGTAWYDAAGALKE